MDSEYQIYLDTIVEEYINKLTGCGCEYETWSSTPHSWCFQPEDVRDSTEEELLERFHSWNEYAMKWLKENLMSYDKWRELNEN